MVRAQTRTTFFVHKQLKSQKKEMHKSAFFLPIHSKYPSFLIIFSHMTGLKAGTFEKYQAF